MDKHTKALELDKILEMVAAEASSEDGAQLARELSPVHTAAEAKWLLEETDAAFVAMAKFGAPSFYGMKNVTNPLRRAQAGGGLGLRELLDIGATLRTIRGLTQWWGKSESVRTALTGRFEVLSPNKYLEEKIFTCIVSEEEVADSASPALAAIRRKIRAASQRVRDQLDKLIHSQAHQKHLQESIVTQRGGRYVVPVKAEFRGEVPGLVHDTSASGATVFVEPMGVVEANNEIRVLRSDEQDEIARILLELSGEAGSFADSIIESYHYAVELVSREGNAFEQVVGRLEEDRRKMEDELEALRASAAQAKANAEASQRLKDEAEAQAKKEIDRARQEAAQIVQKTRQRADALVGELEELRRQKNKQLSAEQKARLRSGLKELESSSDPVHQRRDDNYVLPRPLVVGDEVLLYDIDKEATVLELPKDGTVLVQAGIIKTRVPLGNVRLLSKRQLKKKNPTRTVTKNVSTPETSSSLDLRGQTVEEALMEVDNFLDRASRMHLSQVTIIHGKGTGALRTAVQQHLRRCSQVKSFRLGTYGEGESGVTIAELK